MRKVILAVCAAAIVLAGGMFTPVTASAEAGRGCVTHTFSATHKDYGTEETLYVHQYLVENESSGPVWGSCRVYNVIEIVYPRCSVCGFIDYANPYGSHNFARVHGSCGIATHYY